MAAYIPRRGDVVSLEFDPQSGREQRGRRPALVISHTEFNKRTGLAIVCPLTTTNRNIGLHVPVTDNRALSGFVMIEQVKSVDYRARGAKRISGASKPLLDEVLATLDACIF